MHIPVVRPMARHRKDQAFNPIWVFPAGFACWALAKALGQAAKTVFFLIFVAALLVLVRKVVRPRWLRKSAIAKAEAAIERRMPELMRGRAQLVGTDRYGKPRLEKWTKESEYFLKEHVMPTLSEDEAGAVADQRIALGALVRRRVEESAKSRPAFAGFDRNFAPADFEVFCAEQLQSSGWTSRVTSQSRDQGVDVIAEKGGIRVVLQCKLYSNPVGNKAVQEIAAGRSYQQAHYAAVVTNHRYTPAAEQLASTNDVLLLHYSDLANLENVLSRSRANPPI